MNQTAEDVGAVMIPAWAGRGDLEDGGEYLWQEFDATALESRAVEG